MFQKRKDTLFALVLAMVSAGCAQRLPCIVSVHLEQVPVIHRAVVLPIDDRGVMDQPIPKTVGMGYYRRIEDSGAMMREVLKYELENAAEIEVVGFGQVDDLIKGQRITADELTNVDGEEPIAVGLSLGADVVVAGRIGLCGEEDAPKSPHSYVMGEIYVFESRSGRLVASLQMRALDYPESCSYVSHKMCAELGLKLAKMKEAALKRENELQQELYHKRTPLPHVDRYVGR